MWAYGLNFFGCIYAQTPAIENPDRASSTKLPEAPATSMYAQTKPSFLATRFKQPPANMLVFRFREKVHTLYLTLRAERNAEHGTTMHTAVVTLCCSM